MIIFTHRKHYSISGGEIGKRSTLMRLEICSGLGLCLLRFERAKKLCCRNVLGEKIPPGPAIIRLSWRRWKKAAKGSLIRRLLSEGANAGSDQITVLMQPEFLRNKRPGLHHILLPSRFPSQPGPVWAP